MKEMPKKNRPTSMTDEVMTLNQNARFSNEKNYNKCSKIIRIFFVKKKISLKKSGTAAL
jgi:hypothetical protein